MGKNTDFQNQQLKAILDELKLFEIIEKTETKLVVRKEAKNCVSMKELIDNWEMVGEKEDQIIFEKINKVY